MHMLSRLFQQCTAMGSLWGFLLVKQLYDCKVYKDFLFLSKIIFADPCDAKTTEPMFHKP